MVYDVLIIGAGASGLTAMKKLLEEGYTVCMIEANGQPGGRISTIRDGFSIPIDAGAEFIHGILPVTLGLLREAGTGFRELTGEMIGVAGSEWYLHEPHDEDWDLLLKKLKGQTTDTTLSLFLEENFKGQKYNDLREAACRFAEGFDLADPSTLSVLSIKQEWLQEQHTQYRIPAGYGALIDYLHRSCALPQAQFIFNTPVTNVKHSDGWVSVYAKSKLIAKGRKLVITVSAGIMQRQDINFDPVPSSHIQAFGKLGFGSVIKIVLEFKSPFWMNKRDDIGFILSDQQIPTWWTQLPLETNILTGWLGGTGCLAYADAEEDEILDVAIQSLSVIFSLSKVEIQAQLVARHIAKWTPAHPFSAGGYSYSTIYSEQAINILNTPVNETIYFAGEALSHGASRGTVEAALASGSSVAEKILQDMKFKNQH